MAEEIIVDISPTGEVTAEVKGSKGAKCKRYTDAFRNLGPVVDQGVKPEFYQQESSVAAPAVVKVK